MIHNFINPTTLADFYKVDHRRMYPEGTSEVYSNFTPRTSRISGQEEVVFFGLQYFIKEYLIRNWNENFFNKPKHEVVEKYTRRMNNSLGPNEIGSKHWEDLHDLGYLPIIIKALPEGTKVPLKVPMFTIKNTNPNFFWLTNYLESILSNMVWKPCTSATTAMMYYKEFQRHAKLTGSPENFIKWQGHDFSFRGMSGVEDACLSGAGHLLFFTGTDTIPAIDFLEAYYNADSDKELIGGSVPATEHSVMSLSGKESEIETFKRLITDIYPTGVVSIVSDTWDFWQVMTRFLPTLRKTILARDGRVVIRPDSGDPVKIICGDDLSWNPEVKMGAYELMWNIFGGTINEKGYKVLDPHIGLIYGDSITYDRQKEILRLLEEKKFAASNLVLGIGSFTYEYVTRDTFGFAMKATYGIVNGIGREIFKDPKTDSGMKKSLKGLLQVTRVNENLVVKDQCTLEEESLGELKTVFLDGKLIKDWTLSEIRNNAIL